MLQESEIDCPYCGESQVLLIEPLSGRQNYTEDCQVCCRPMIIHIGPGTDDPAAVEAWREDDV